MQPIHHLADRGRISSNVRVLETGFRSIRPGRTTTGRGERITLSRNLDITSRCITHSSHKDDSGPHRPREELYNVVTRILGIDSDAEGKRSPGIYCPSHHTRFDQAFMSDENSSSRVGTNPANGQPLYLQRR